MGKDLDSKIKEMDAKIKQILLEKQQLIKKSKEDERKKRTRELIQIGAILDGIGIKTIAQAEALKKELQNKPEILETITKHDKNTEQEAKPSEDKIHEE